MGLSMDALLRQLVEAKGSDLHLTAGLRPAMRVKGELVPIEGTEAFTPQSIESLIYSVLTEHQIRIFEDKPDTRYELDFAYGIAGLGRFRFNVHRQRGTAAAVIRALSSRIPALESLGLPTLVADFATYKKGLVLVTGPTGSGKSTTLASLIDRINSTRADHILTIEDPIEYVHNSKKSYVTQREVGESGDTMSFANGLKYALRQDPDVILIGEMRDAETIGIAITAAETGHLVFGTLHTSSAAQTVGRIIDVFPADKQPQIITQLSANLLGVVSQILLPTADGSGRCVCAEVMKATSGIRNQIRTNSVDGLYQSIQTGSKDGMQTMDQAIYNLVRLKKVDYETVKPYIRDEATHRQIREMLGIPDAPLASPVPVKLNPPPEVGPRLPGSRIIPPWEKQ